MSEAAEERLAVLEQRLAAAELAAARAQDRGDVENVFNRYMHYHNAFEDERIIDELWVRRGTEGVRSQYNDDGAYTDWDTIMQYHRGRPHPVGKLILHHTTTPVIEVSADGSTAKGLWLMAGLESGLTEPAEAERIPPFFFAQEEVDGRKVWAHWVWCKYGVDFLKQDGRWRIWRFRCFEVARAPFDENWIAFAAHERAQYEAKLMYFGDDGKPVYLPPVDGPTVTRSQPYQIDTAQHLVPEPPQPYAEYEDTFRLDATAQRTGDRGHAHPISAQDSWRHAAHRGRCADAAAGRPGAQFGAVEPAAHAGHLRPPGEYARRHRHRERQLGDG